MGKLSKSETIMNFVQTLYNTSKMSWIIRPPLENKSSRANLIALSHHRTCRSAYGGSVSYLILLQRFYFLFSNNLSLPAFYLIYVSFTLHIGSEQNIFLYVILNRLALPDFSVLWPLLTSHSSLLLQISLPMRPHGINQYFFLVYPLNIRTWVTVTFWTSLLLVNLSAKYALVLSFCP